MTFTAWQPIVLIQDMMQSRRVLAGLMVNVPIISFPSTISKDFPKVSTVKKPKEKPHFTLTKPNFNIFIYMILQSKIFNHKTYYFLHGFWSKKEPKVFSKLMFPSKTSQLVWRNINLRLFVVSSTASSRYIQSHYRTSWVVHLLIRKSIQMEGGGHEIMICLDFAIVSSNYQAENSSINF